MARGGVRPGSGAPKGNLNHLNHGRRSKQIHEAIERALQDPKGRGRVLAIVRSFPPEPPAESPEK